MRVLGDTLTAAQLAMGDAKLRLALTKTSQATKTYYIDSGDDRILALRHTEQEWSQVAQIAIQDSSHTIADLSPDLRGYKGVISYGYGANYSACAPLWVMAQKTDSFGGGIVTSLSLAGTFNLMGEDRASVAYTPDTSNTDTVKTILTAVCEKTLAPFTHCTSYTATFDVSTGIIDTLMPKDSFRVYLNDTRLAVIKRLMQYVGYKCRVEADAQIHFFIPTVSSSTYDYEYEDVVTEHNFYEKSVRKRVVIPNYVVVSSHPDHESPYAGWTNYKADTTDDGDIEKREYKYLRVTSDAQCLSIATNLLLHHQMDAEKGHGFAPMNCGQEVFDYVNITDSRVGDSRAGNIGYINREYAQGKFTMEFRFGSIAPGLYLGTMPPQMITKEPTAAISTAALAEQIMTLWDNQMALVDAIIETKQEVITLEPDAGIPSGAPAGTTWATVFDGPGGDSVTSAAWMYEAGLPFTPTGSIFLSPVMEEIPNIFIVYVIDQGTNFWKYNLTEKNWTKLASPSNSATGVNRTIAVDDVANPTELWIPTASTTHLTGTLWGVKLQKYTIATDVWSAESALRPEWSVRINTGNHTGVFAADDKITGGTSGATGVWAGAQADVYVTVRPFTDTKFVAGETITGVPSGASAVIDAADSFGTSPNFVYGEAHHMIQAIVYQSSTVIYCFTHRSTGDESGRCIIYNPTANTWAQGKSTATVSVNESTDHGVDGTCIAVNSGNTIVYLGSRSDDFVKYTIATDAYADNTLTAGRRFAFAHDKDKLPYVNTTTFRQGYLDTADDSENDNQFAENTERTAGYGDYFGVTDDWADITAHARSAAPRLMSVISGGMYLLGTFYANGFTQIHIEKPEDNYPVTVVNTAATWTHAYDGPRFGMIPDGTYNVYYPQVGDYTLVTVKYQVI